MIKWVGSDNIDAVLKGLHDKLSYAQIARTIPGATRNSVAGIVHRLHQAARDEAGAPPPRSPATAKRRAA